MRGASVSGHPRQGLVLGLAVLLALTAACTAQPTQTATAPAQPTVPPAVLQTPVLQPGERVPAPDGPPVLTLTGKIAETNGDKSLRFDPAGLDRLGLVEVTVYEPWVKQDLQFQGVWLADLLKVAQPERSAQSIHLTALDDYQIDLNLTDVMAGGILLATKTGDGSSIPIEDGGPTRIVFVGGISSGANADRWIWSLSMIDVR